MVTPSAGSVMLVRFPFSDLTGAKLRAGTARPEWILCQVTSNPYADVSAISIGDEDFRNGGLQRASFARPGKLFTASVRLMVADIGTLRQDKFTAILRAVISTLQASIPGASEPVPNR